MEKHEIRWNKATLHILAYIYSETVLYYKVDFSL